MPKSVIHTMLAHVHLDPGTLCEVGVAVSHHQHNLVSQSVRYRPLIPPLPHLTSLRIDERARVVCVQWMMFGSTLL